MNVSDQNVFTLDTAFKRRWEYKRIKNNIDECPFKNKYVPGTDKTWKEFTKTINYQITSNQSILNREDKQIGAFFISPDNLSKTKNDKNADAESFAYKVLGYLWDDVFRNTRNLLFNTSRYNTLEQLVQGFKENWNSVFNKMIFQNGGNNEEQSSD